MMSSIEVPKGLWKSDVVKAKAVKEDQEHDDSEYDFTREDICYECGGYGDDFSFDEDGELVCNCPTCPFNEDNVDNEDE